jgi:HEAT repeat protein
MIAIGAILLAAWFVWSKYVPFGGGGQQAVVGRPGEDRGSIEAQIKQGKAAVPALIASLDSADPKDRSLALYGLGRIGRDASEALVKIRKRLADDNERVRKNAISALIDIDPNREAAATAIAPLLADPSPSVRESAGTGLCQVGPPAIKPLLEMVRSDQAVARLEALRTLGMTFHSIQPVLWDTKEAERLEAIRSLANDPVPDIRLEAITLAAERGTANPSEIKELLHDPVRFNIALAAVGKLGEAAEPLLPDVLAFLDDQTAFEEIDPNLSRTDVRFVPGRLKMILSTLKSMKKSARGSTDRLVEIGMKRHDYPCIVIAQTLYDIGAEDGQVASVLVPLVLNPHKSLSWLSGQALVMYCPDEARREVSRLLPNLGTNESTVDKTVLYALHSLGPQAQEAVPALIPLLHNSDPWVSEFAAHVLTDTGPAAVDAVPSLTGLVCDNSLAAGQRVACAKTLARIGPLAQSAVPALLERFAKKQPTTSSKDSDLGDANVRATIIHTLGRIGGNEKELIDILRAELSDPSPDVRAASADALGRVATESPEVLDDLVRRLNGDDPPVRAMTALAIGRMRCDRTKAVVPLADALSSPNREVCTAAALSLRKIGPAAKAALPALRGALATRNQKAFGGMRPHWWIEDPEFISGDFYGVIREAIAEIEEPSETTNETDGVPQPPSGRE